MDMRERRDQGTGLHFRRRGFRGAGGRRRILQRLNFMDRSDFAGIAEVVKELLGRSENAMINPPFYCDYGTHIRVGKNFFANYNCYHPGCGQGHHRR